MAFEEPTLRVVGPEFLTAACPEAVQAEAREQAAAILAEVKASGEKGLVATAIRLGDLKEGEAYTRSREECEAAFRSLPEDEQQLLERTAGRIRAFAEAQRASITAMETDIPGGRAGQTVAPVVAAGCYAPGGRYPLPSSVLMTAVTARAAGVKQVWVASPRPSAVTLGAAFVAGADGFLCVGGAQAVAALAYGVECSDGLGGRSVPPCDVIVGPGNRWVTAAKSLVSGVCAIDMLAGPSEVLVIADGTSDPATVAADLLAQAEHDVDARPILVALGGMATVDAVNAELQRQLVSLPTAPVARQAVAKGFAVLAGSVAEAVALSDRVAPEHLEVLCADAAAVAGQCEHYGGLFVGAVAAEVLGDYGAGPNHVLPTGGTARFSGGLSVFNFLRVRTWMRIDDAAASHGLVSDAVQLARLEGLEGHARAAEKRLTRAAGGPAVPPTAKKAKA